MCKRYIYVYVLKHILSYYHTGAKNVQNHQKHTQNAKERNEPHPQKLLSKYFFSKLLIWLRTSRTERKVRLTAARSNQYYNDTDTNS